VKHKGRTLNFRKANFQLFKESVNQTSWETALREDIRKELADL